MLKKGLRRREREAGVAKGAQNAPFATPASFPHLHCPQAQVCAAAELQKGWRLACFSAPSASQGADDGQLLQSCHVSP